MFILINMNSSTWEKKIKQLYKNWTVVIMLFDTDIAILTMISLRHFINLTNFTKSNFKYLSTN